jgi:type I restriction enzyme, S subunit
MNAEKFLANFGHIANAPGGVERLRDLVLQLAVTGVLVRQQASEGNADALIAEVTRSRDRMIAAGLLKPRALLPEVDLASQAQLIPQQWRWVRLGNLASKLGSGSTPRGGSKVYTMEGIPFLRSQNVWNNCIRLDDVVFIDPKTHAEMDGTHVAANDVLLNITGASLGRCAVVPADFTAANVSQHVTIIRPLVTETRHFLRICLLSPFGQAMIWGRQVGMAREGLSKKVLEQFEIPLPPLKEQKRIVAKVDELMALVDQFEAQQQERNRLVEAFAKACVASVTGTTPTTIVTPRPKSLAQTGSADESPYQ